MPAIRRNVDGRVGGVKRLRRENAELKRVNAILKAVVFLRGRARPLNSRLAPRLPRAQLESRCVPAGAQVVPVGDEPPGQIILLADDGFLSLLEYVWIDDDAPREWPDEDGLRLNISDK